MLQCSTASACRVAYALIRCVSCCLVISMPCVPFTLAAGFLYGTLLGSCIISIASCVAAVVAFLAARYLARNWIESQLATGGKTSRFRLIDNAIQQDGFRIVLLIRSSPLHPYGACKSGTDAATLHSSAAGCHSH